MFARDKSQNGTVMINSHGTGKVGSNTIERTGTGIPGSSIEHHGTGLCPPSTGRVVRGLLLSLVLFLGLAGTAAAQGVRHFQQGGLSVSLVGDQVTATWIRADGLIAMAQGTMVDGFASLPLAVAIVDQFGKIQQTGTGIPPADNGKIQQTGTGIPPASGGKIQQTGTGIPPASGGKIQQTGTGIPPASGDKIQQTGTGIPPSSKLASVAGGRLELVLEDGLVGTATMAFKDGVKSELAFAFDRTGQFVSEQVRR